MNTQTTKRGEIVWLKNGNGFRKVFFANACDSLGAVKVFAGSIRRGRDWRVKAAELYDKADLLKWFTETHPLFIPAVRARTVVRVSKKTNLPKTFFPFDRKEVAKLVNLDLSDFESLLRLARKAELDLSPPPAEPAKTP